MVKISSYEMHLLNAFLNSFFNSSNKRGVENDLSSDNNVKRFKFDSVENEEEFKVF